MTEVNEDDPLSVEESYNTSNYHMHIQWNLFNRTPQIKETSEVRTKNFGP